MKFNPQIFLISLEKAQKLPLSGSQKLGLAFLLSKVSNDPVWGADLRKVAYFLATIQHETAGEFQPINEIRERSTSPRRLNQDRYWLTGFHGRGYVQITWKKNYVKFGIRNSPEDALKPDIAYRIASTGMIEGIFTGKSLSDYISADTCDYVGARHIINGTDRADEIAVKAVRMQCCLYLALIRPTAVSPPPASPAPDTKEPTSSALSGLVRRVREKYSSASEGEKSLVARAGQLVWSAALGAIAFVQTRPIHTAVVILVLILGYLALRAYSKRQDAKTKAILAGMSK